MPVPFIGVVSEDPESLESIQKGLQAIGYPARGYSHLKTALQSALSAPPALLVFDLGLTPEQSGKLLTFIRLQDRLRRIPLIFLARKSHPLTEWHPQDEGSAVLDKPITLGELVGQIRRLLLEAPQGRTANRKTAPEKAAAASLPVPAPTIHTVTACWLGEELEITANGKHFLSDQEIQEALGIPSPGSTQMAIDGDAVPTAFFSSTQLKARVPASHLKERRQFTLQVSHPACCSGATARVTVDLPPRPESRPQGGKPAAEPAAKVPSPHATAPRIDRLEPPTLSPIAPQGSGETAPIGIRIHGQDFPEDAVAYLEGTPLPTEYVSASCLVARIPAKLAAREGEAAITVAYPRDRGLRLTNRSPLRIAAAPCPPSPPCRDALPALKTTSARSKESPLGGS